MKAVIQRVMKASVLVNGEIINSIENGLCVLIGIKTDDILADAEYLAEKILNLKIFESETGKRWATSVMDRQYEILCISQFTLYHIIKGKKLDFHKAMPAALAEPFYKNFLAELGHRYKPELIKDGRFGAMMDVHIENHGPVTLEIESAIKEDVTSL